MYHMTAMSTYTVHIDHIYCNLILDASCSNLTLDYPRVTNAELRNYLTVDSSSITVTIKNLPDGIARAIVGYAKLNHGVWVEGEYANLRLWQSRTFSPLVPGTTYRVTAWGLSGGNTDDRRRCRKPTVIYVSMSSQRKCLQDLHYNNNINFSPSILMTLAHARYHYCKVRVIRVQNSWVRPPVLESLGHLFQVYKNPH